MGLLPEKKEDVSPEGQQALERLMRAYDVGVESRTPLFPSNPPLNREERLRLLQKSRDERDQEKKNGTKP